MESSPKIGIDLGTTNSCVAVYQDGKVCILENELGYRVTPSIVSFGEDTIDVGQLALKMSLKNCLNTIYDSKRMLGREYSDAVLQSDMKNWPFKVENKNGKPIFDIFYQGKTQFKSPEEISSKILLKMKETAELRLNKPIKDAVITVPAYFNEAQRQATKDAASIAGLNVLKLLNEPIAAAIAYGIDKKRDCERRVLIYDLGGGTFDVSLLTVKDHEFRAKTYAGNSHLGGQDFNNRMMEHIIKEVKTKYKEDISLDKKALAKLRDACETAKKELTSTRFTKICIENLTPQIELKMDFSRATFEILNEDLFQLTLNEVESALNEIKWDKSSIDDVVLIGGSTRIPKIRENLRKFFDGKALYTSINPDEAVAYGAAMQAVIEGGGKAKLSSGFKFLDVTPMSYGADSLGDVYVPIIPRNTEIPTSQRKTYQTASHNQASMPWKILEGERKMASDNCLIGTLTLKNIPIRPRGEAKAEIIMNIDANGILNVEAIDLSNRDNNVKLYQILSYHNRLTKDQIKEAIEIAENEKINDERRVERALARNSLTQYCDDVERMIQDKSETEFVKKTLIDIQEWLQSSQDFDENEFISQRETLSLAFSAIQEP